MNYKLVKSSDGDVERLIEYKKRTIFEYAKDLPEDEIIRINNYVENNVPKILNNYNNIIINNKIVGCLLLTDKDDGILLDEIYLEEGYRNQGIGTDIIKNVIKETDSRHYMKYAK